MNELINRSRIPIVFTLEGLGQVCGTFVRVCAPLTVEEIVKSLPLEGRASLWDGEVYFSIPVKRGEEKARLTVDKGDIAYWPMGAALCVFLASIRPYSPVNLVGKIEEGLELFGRVKQGTRIKVKAAERKG